MADESDRLFDTPEDEVETTEYEDAAEGGPEIDPEDEQEPEDRETAIRRAEMEEQFARYERNFRARRIES